MALDLQRTIQTARDFGWVVCDRRMRSRQGASSDEELDAYCDTLGLSAMGEATASAQKGGWRETTVDESRHILAHWLQHSMTYGPALTGAGGSANVLEPFFSLFGASARFFTNVRNTGTWSPKTGHTLDAGVIVVDDEAIGIVWFADED